MSLIPNLQDDNANKRRPPNAMEERLQNGKILRPDVLVEKMREVANEKVISAEERKEAIKGNYRTKDRHGKFPLHGVLQKVDAEIWSNMTNASMAGQLKNIQVSQNNGDWRPFEVEVDIARDRSGDECIFLGVRWVDMNNAPEQAYANGQPVASIKVENKFSEELMQRMNSTQDDELKNMLKDLIHIMTLNATQSTANTPPSIQMGKKEDPKSN